MFSNFLGIMAITIYNQTYGASGVMSILKRYNSIADSAMSLNVFTAMITAIQSIAVAITVILYLIDLSEKVTERNFSTEQFIKATLRMIVSYLFIVNATKIVGYLLGAGNAVANEITESVEGYDFFTNTANGANHKTMLINGIKQMNVAEVLGFIASTLVPWILAMLCTIVVSVVMISRILEIIVATIFAPLAIADIYREGTSSQGIQYMKKVLALGLQVAVIILINSATQAIIANMSGLSTGESVSGLLTLVDGLTGSASEITGGVAKYTEESVKAFLNALTGKPAFWKSLGIMFARVGLIWNSLSLCEEITGAK